MVLNEISKAVDFWFGERSTMHFLLICIANILREFVNELYRLCTTVFHNRYLIAIKSDYRMV